MNKYNIPVGVLVEVKEVDVESERKNHGIRLYVTLHRKDSEGNSKYSLGLKGETNSLKMFHGYTEEHLKVIDKISVELTKDEIKDIVQWGSTCEDEGWLIEKEVILKGNLSKLI